MSENQFQIAAGGTSLITADVNQLGSYALMDDRVFAEFLRLAPFNGTSPDRAIFPYGVTGEFGAGTYSQSYTCTVAPNGASGSVLVRPFRAFVGSRTPVGTDAKANWRDIRSALFIGSGTSLTSAVTLASNSSGNPRWDLVYASISPDAATATVTRKQKATVSPNAITNASVVTTLQSTVTVSVVTGTTGASPTFPALPADGAGAYNIALAYVRVPTGFTGTSIVARTDIADAMPVAAPTLGPASGNSTAVVSTALQQSWGASGTRPGHLVPADLGKGPSKVIAIDLLDASSTNWSHQSGGTVDSSIDWRNRLFKVAALVQASSVSATHPFIWDQAGTASPALQIPSYQTVSNRDSQYVLSESINNTNQVTSPTFTGGVIYSASETPTFQTNTQVWLVADATTGALKLYVKGAPQVALYLWIDMTTQFPNRA